MRLPSAYQEVEYIESSGTQRINTGITPTQNIKSQIKFRNLAATGDVIYGMYDGSDTADYRFFNASTYAYFDIGGSRINNTTSNTIAVGTDYELEVGNYYVKNLSTGVNILSGSAIGSYTGSSTIKLNYTSNGTISSNRRYYVKIWEGNTQIRDMVPCYRKSDNVIGMYDLVNDTFYTNSGTGIFSKGNDITPEYKLHGAIQTFHKKKKWKPGENTIFYYNIDYTDDNSTLYDKSGNGYDLTWNKTPTYATDATYGRVVQNMGVSTAAAYRNYIDLGTTQTCNILINVTGNSGWNLVLLSGATGLQYTDLDWFLGISPTGLELRNESQNTNISTTNSGWELITVTRDANGVVFYKNGTQIGTWSYIAVTYNNYLQLFNNKVSDIGGTSYIKTIIMEDKVWTQQEIQDLATEYGLI